MCAVFLVSVSSVYSFRPLNQQHIADIRTHIPYIDTHAPSVRIRIECYGNFDVFARTQTVANNNSSSGIIIAAMNVNVMSHVSAKVPLLASILTPPYRHSISRMNTHLAFGKDSFNWLTNHSSFSSISMANGSFARCMVILMKVFGYCFEVWNCSVRILDNRRRWKHVFVNFMSTTQLNVILCPEFS